MRLATEAPHEQGTNGHPGPRPQRAAPIFENIPDSIKAERRWCVWRDEFVDGRWTKVPYRSDGRGKADSTDPSTWSDYQSAMRAYECGDYAGIGFMLGDGYAGVDLDHCLNDCGSFVWGSDIVAPFNSYAEVSPGLDGVKILVLGRKPENSGCSKKGMGPEKRGKVESWDHDRFFTLTGNILDGKPQEVLDCTEALAEMCGQYLRATPAQENEAICSGNLPEQTEGRVRGCLIDVLKMNVQDGGDGSHRLFSACCRAIEHDLSDTEAVKCIRDYHKIQPFPTAWSDADIIRRLRDAEKRTARGKVSGEPLEPIAAADLCREFPEMRPEVVEGLIREAETAYMIGESKAKKTHSALSLALCIITGRMWLHTFTIKRTGPVLYIDAELHRETLARRIVSIASAMGILSDQYVDKLDFLPLRGRLRDINQLASFFAKLPKGKYRLIVIDSLYRLLPKGCDENSNADITAIFNMIDRYAEMTGAAIFILHHSSKGGQGGKSVVDVGAGAGAGARAVDNHIVMRAHAEDGCVVMETAPRTFPPIDPLCLRWNYPSWSLAPELDPTDLRPDGRKKKAEPKSLSDIYLH